MARKKVLTNFLPCAFIILGLQGVHLILGVGGQNEYKIFDKVANFFPNGKGTTLPCSAQLNKYFPLKSMMVCHSG